MSYEQKSFLFFYYIVNKIVHVFNLKEVIGVVIKAVMEEDQCVVILATTELLLITQVAVIFFCFYSEV